ncbi:hypothetical protein [Candidatus Nitrososphaera gargensis]|uniref:hypothetical protein n=1 Tax=Candidatus Nitrososphaera gargensis TaxID=497727 RepID=UPI0011E55DE1|nr:hypothetical protein [Candidatus Nitrososphaera gargensis]
MMAQLLQMHGKIDDRYAHCLIPTSEKEKIILGAIKEQGNNATTENIGKLIIFRYASPALAASAMRRMEQMRKWGTIQFHKHNWRIGPNATILSKRRNSEEDPLHGLAGVSLGTVPQELAEHFCQVCDQLIVQYADAEIIMYKGRLYICHAESCYDQLYKKINMRVKKRRTLKPLESQRRRQN